MRHHRSVDVSAGSVAPYKSSYELQRDTSLNASTYRDAVLRNRSRLA